MKQEDDSIEQGMLLQLRADPKFHLFLKWLETQVPPYPTANPKDQYELLVHFRRIEQIEVLSTLLSKFDDYINSLTHKKEEPSQDYDYTRYPAGDDYTIT